MNTPPLSTRRWALLGIIMLALWQFALAFAFAARAEMSIQLLALLGTLLWAFPFGLAVGTLFHRRWHIAWIFPLALLFTTLILYTGFTTAECLAARNTIDLNPAHSPRTYHLPIAITVCPFSAAGIAFGFLAHPRPYARPKRFRCIACNYDLRQSLPTSPGIPARCPECGHTLIPGVDFPAHLPPGAPIIPEGPEPPMVTPPPPHPAQDPAPLPPPSPSSHS